MSPALAVLMTAASPEPIRARGGSAKKRKGTPEEASEEEDSAAESSADADGGGLGKQGAMKVRPPRQAANVVAAPEVMVTMVMTMMMMTVKMTRK